MLGTATRYTHTLPAARAAPRPAAVKSITVSAIAGHPDKELYTAVIANQGLTGAGPFEVLFAPGDSSAPTTRHHQLPRSPVRARTLSFVGPLCDSASPPTVIADPTSQVDDYDRSNNALTRDLPGGPERLAEAPGLQATRR